VHGNEHTSVLDSECWLVVRPGWPNITHASVLLFVNIEKVKLRNRRTKDMMSTHSLPRIYSTNVREDEQTEEEIGLGSDSTAIIYKGKLQRRNDALVSEDPRDTAV
jgi:hypothetical protein